MTIAGWILVMSIWGEPAVIPTPYSSVETCTEAAHTVHERVKFFCVPLEAPNVRGFLDGLKQGLEQFQEQTEQ